MFKEKSTSICADLSCPYNKSHKARYRNHSRCAVARPTPFHRQVESLRCNEYVTRRHHRHKQCRHYRNHIAVSRVARLVEEDRSRPEGEHSERLIGPREVSPHDIKIDKYHAEHTEKQRDSNHQSFSDLALVEVQKVRHYQSC